MLAQLNKAGIKNKKKNSDDSSISLIDSDNASYWLNHLQVRGGGEFRNNSPFNLSSTDSSNITIKTKWSINEELNVLDKVITKDIVNSNKLLNNIHDNNNNNDDNTHVDNNDNGHNDDRNDDNATRTNDNDTNDNDNHDNNNDDKRTTFYAEILAQGIPPHRPPSLPSPRGGDTLPLVLVG